MIDDKDRKIIDCLIDNSRQSFREISKKLGVSTVTVMKRARRLEKEKVLGGYTALVDYEKLGYDIDVMINIKVAHGKFSEVYPQLKKYDNVTAIYDVTGDFDAAIVAKFRNRKQLDAFLKKLQLLPHVERTHTVFVLNVLEKRSLHLAHSQ